MCPGWRRARGCSPRSAPAAGLLASLAFVSSLARVESATAVLRDHDDSRCPTWAASGECERNPSYMLESCSLSCSQLAKTARVPADDNSDSEGEQAPDPHASNGMRLCPIRIGSRRRRGSSAAGHVHLTVANEQMGNLELLYYDGAAEKRYWVVDARGTFDVATRAGDVWRLRMKSGELAAEITVGGGGVQRATIPHCLPPAQRAEAEAATAHDVAMPDAAQLQPCAPWQHLSTSEPSPGMHVVCILATAGAGSDGAVAWLAVYADGWTGSDASLAQPPPSHAVALPAPHADSVEAVARFVMQRLGVPRRGPRHQPPAAYLPSGTRIESVAELLSAACVIIFEGGMWVWPALEVGHTRQLEVNDGTASPKRVSLRTLSLSPRVLLASDVLTEAEAGLIMSRAEGHMFKSGVSLKAADAGKASSDYRTSSQWSFPLWDPAILHLDRRVQQLTRIPMTHAEQIQVVAPSRARPRAARPLSVSVPSRAVACRRVPSRAVACRRVPSCAVACRRVPSRSLISVCARVPRALSSACSAPHARAPASTLVHPPHRSTVHRVARGTRSRVGLEISAIRALHST